MATDRLAKSEPDCSFSAKLGQTVTETLLCSVSSTFLAVAAGCGIAIISCTDVQPSSPVKHLVVFSEALGNVTALSWLVLVNKSSGIESKDSLSDYFMVGTETGHFLIYTIYGDLAAKQKLHDGPVQRIQLRPRPLSK